MSRSDHDDYKSIMFKLHHKHKIQAKQCEEEEFKFCKLLPLDDDNLLWRPQVIHYKPARRQWMKAEIVFDQPFLGKFEY